MNKRKMSWALGLAAAVCVLPRTGAALTARELADLLERGQAVTVVDVRSPADYARSHIPGAINLPAELLGSRQVPPLGRVVVCGDGILEKGTRDAVSALNAKAGIRAEALEGGLAAWEALALPATRDNGVRAEALRYLSYQELVAAAGNPDLVLVDLRRGESPLTDLAARFPRAGLVRPDRGRGEEAGAVIGRDPPGRKLYVLVDDGDGESEAVARRLRAAGVGRVAILAGGEKSVAREGRSGRVTRESAATP